jgi:hypothetical protein
MPNRSPERAEFLHDILVTFVEDYGTNSWRQIKEWHYDEEHPERATATFIDREDDDKEWPVTIETIATGLRRVLANEMNVARQYRDRFRIADGENDAGLIDAYDADIIVQAGAFNKVIYG